MGKWTKIGLGGVLLVAIAAIGGSILDAGAYRDRIYPGVSVMGIDVGGQTVGEATAVLAGALPGPDVQGVTLQAAGQFWRMTWSAVGQRYDVAATAEAAYRVGRGGSWLPTLPVLWRVREQGRAVPPVVVPADPARVRAYLERVAAVLDAPPVDAQLQLVGGSAVAAPGASGRRLNVEAGAAPVLQALADGAQSVALTPESVPPMRAEPEPAYRKAQALLAQQFTLVAADPLTGEPPAGYHAEFTAPPDRIAAWLEPRPEQADIKLYINTAAVRAWLQEIAPQVGDSRTLSVDETLRPVVAALYAGEHRAEARIRHPEGVYVVQPGDNFYDIAYSLGFPQWQLERANPDVDPGVIDVGQVLTVPSLDVLFPYSLAPGKRIEIDLPTQTLRAYENDRQVFEFKVSSGISSTPTIAGQFQVLFKEENALAQRWSLDMPYFMAIYEEGEDYYNGIHELPITSYGTRLSAGVLGWPASYGCIIVDVGAAEALYNWAPMGTLVRITGVAPGTPTWQETLADIAPPTTDQ